MIKILNGYQHIVSASCPSAIWQVFLFMREIRSLLLLTMEVYFYSYFIVLFPSGLIKLMMNTTMIFFLYFLHFRCCSFFFLASSICLCHKASFILNLHNKKKSLKVIMSDALLISLFVPFTNCFKDMIIVVLITTNTPNWLYLTVYLHLGGSHLYSIFIFSSGLQWH